MTNKQIILEESLRLVEAGILKSTGVMDYIELEDESVIEFEVPEAINTYQRWKQLGYAVKKGEKAITCIKVWKPFKSKAEDVDTEDEENQDKTHMYLKKAYFFKQDQCEKICEGV